MRLTGLEDEDAGVSPRLQYYNKVLRLLEDLGLAELVIQLATMAISEAAGDARSQVLSLRRSDPSLLRSPRPSHCAMCPQAALRTRIFKHHLDLGHNSQAYEALTQNPDCGRWGGLPASWLGARGPPLICLTLSGHFLQAAGLPEAAGGGAV